MGVLGFIFYTFVGVVFIQVIFYIFFFSKFAFQKYQKKSSYNLPISVIICAKNEANNLKKNLPLIIDQEYPDFEIVLINDASQDNSLKIMQEFASLNKQIKIVDVKSIEAFWGNKKYALTLGIKAATNKYLLFTDADCKPLSKYWIKEMSSHFNNENSIVLGYGGYSKIKKSFLNKLIRFETLVTAVHYFSFAAVGMPYMGVGRNLAYAKKEFFNANGFISHIKVRSGDDDLFINQVANKKNTSICFSKNSFTQSSPKTTFEDWFKQKRRHVSTAKYYKLNHKMLLTLIYITQFLFWVLGFVLLIFLYKWKLVCSLLLVRIILQYVMFGISSKKLGESDLIIILPVLEIFLISAQLTIFINNLISKPNHWK